MSLRMPKAVIIGAGALGLGFLAERLADDYALHLSDTSANEGLLRRLEAEQGFTLNLCGLYGVDTRQVSGSFTASLTDAPEGRTLLNRALQEADIVLTATGWRFLDVVVSTIRPVMNARSRKVWLLFCENGLHIAESHAPSFAGHVVLADTVMSRMCRFGEPGDTGFSPLWPNYGKSLIVEDYRFFPLDELQCGAGGNFAPLFSLISHAEFALWEDVKFYLHNGMHAFVAYRAFLEGVERFPDVSASIRRDARDVMLTEVIPALIHVHSAARRHEIEGYALELLERFFNPFFNDSVARGIRGVEEKLQPSERLLGGCEYIRRAGIEPRGYEGTIRAAREILAKSR
jgi:mannitol-1-phosphate/altronate dehydrogenase